MDTHTPRTVSVFISKKLKANRDVEIPILLAAGKVVRFTNLATGSFKDVKRWNVDKDGDLLAFRGSKLGSKYVCYASSAYSIEAVEMDNREGVIWED